jgi:hypothetical protein
VPKTDRLPTPPFSEGEGEGEDEDDEGSHSADSRSPIDRRGFQEAVWPSPDYGDAYLSSSTHAHSPAFSATGTAQAAAYAFDSESSVPACPRSLASGSGLQPAALPPARFFFPTPVEAFLSFVMRGRYPEVLEHLFRRPEHLFTAGDGSFCVAVGQEAVVLAAMQHGLHQLDCALSVEHVYGLGLGFRV